MRIVAGCHGKRPCTGSGCGRRGARRAPLRPGDHPGGARGGYPARTGPARHAAALPISVVHASQVIEMARAPQPGRAQQARLLHGRGHEAAARRQADAFVSAGNSGGVLAAALASAGRIGRIKGIQRPGPLDRFPHPAGLCLMLDIGANTDCKPEWLVQFALMGSIYAQQGAGHRPAPRGLAGQRRGRDQGQRRGASRPTRCSSTSTSTLSAMSRARTCPRAWPM